MSKRVCLFVYGTLMNGMEADTLLAEKNARLVGRGKIRGKLVDLGEFPGALRSNSSRDVVFGELYEVAEDSVLADLDGYEEYDPNNPEGSLFVRDRVRVDLIDASGRSVEAWTYFYNERRAGRRGRPIPSGDYRSYRREMPSPA